MRNKFNVQNVLRKHIRRLQFQRRMIGRDDDGVPSIAARQAGTPEKTIR